MNADDAQANGRHLMTPHIAGAFLNVSYGDRDYFLTLLRRFISGEALYSVVDRSRGY